MVTLRVKAKAPKLQTQKGRGMVFSCLSVGAGGFIGAVLRYLANIGCKQFAAPFIITLCINVLGSFAIMFFSAWLGRQFQLDSNLMLFLRIGLCGGFTTFSTFSAENMAFIQQEQFLYAAAYAAASVVLCVAAAFAGELVASKIV